MNNISYFCMEEEIESEVLEVGKCSRKIKKYDGQLMMVEVLMEDYYVSEPHKHPHQQMTYVLEGEFTFHVGSESKDVKEGDTIFMPPDMMHNCELKCVRGRLLDVFSPIREDFLIREND